jgi:predicted nucleic acid-binding protein
LSSRIKRVVVDTSVFVDFFRNSHPKNREIKELIETQLAVLSPFVRLELLAGVKAADRKVLSNLLNSLDYIRVDQALFELAENLMPLYKQRGLNVGLVDYLITLQALSMNAQIFTRDKQMIKLAKILDIPLTV